MDKKNTLRCCNHGGSVVNIKIYLSSLLIGMVFAGCNTSEEGPVSTGPTGWEMVGNLGKRVNAILAYNENTVIAGTKRGQPTEHGLYVSYDAGETWENIIEEDVTVNDIDLDIDNQIYASTEGAGVILIPDILQLDYQILNNGLSSMSVNSIALDPDATLYAADDDSGIYRYENDQFKLYKEKLNSSSDGQVSANINGDIYYSVRGRGIFRINFATKVEERIQHSINFPEHIFPIADKLYIYVRHIGLFLYESFNIEPRTGFIDSNITVHDMLRINGRYYMGCSVKGVSISDDGTNWRDFNQGLSSAEVTALTTYNGVFLYAANSAGEIYKRRLK